MATSVSGKAKVERGVPGNPGTRVRNPYIVVNSKRDKKLVERPAFDEKRYIATEINLYGP